LREYFEVNSNYIAWSALQSLKEQGKIDDAILSKAKKKLNIKANKNSPVNVK
jgi:pyruvate dehydrogenase complex dehydrogenase (E1) component